LAENGVEVRAYDAIYQDLPEVSVKSVLYNPPVVNHSLVEALPKDVEKIEDVDPTDERKSVKNDTEIQNTIQAHIKDGVAVTKFIYWLKKNIGKMEMTEISAADYLEERRKEQEHFLDLSFETISAYGPNAAMMHYEPTPEKFSKLKPEGFLLVDSGAHYLEGTTDITRTIVLGELTEKMKEYFTVTLRSNLRLSAAKFPEGTIGQNLDVLARGPVWDMGLDYRCGTGHGVGHILNVHEGPQSFRWRVMDRAKVWRLKPGMITTNEPGLYIEDEFGIRHENELLCREAEKTEYGQYYHFQVITYAPFDLDAIKPEMLTYLEKEELNRYHKMVYDTLSPYMTEEENAWLKEATRAI
jgi:Xaa-Pro aminopeptidase